MHSEHKLKAKLQAYAPRVCGIRQHANNTRRRRVSGWVMKKLQKGAWPQKPVQPTKAARACFRRFFAAPTPSAALASQLGKLPQSEKVSQPPARVPQSETSASQPCKFPRARKLAITLANIPKCNPSPPHWQPFPRSASHKDPLLAWLSGLAAVTYGT